MTPQLIDTLEAPYAKIDRSPAICDRVIADMPDIIERRNREDEAGSVMVDSDCDGME